MAAIFPLPRRRRRTGSGVAMALATLGFGVAKGFAERKKQKGLAAAARAEAEMKAEEFAYKRGREGKADARAEEDQNLQRRAAGRAEIEFEQGQAALPQKAADAEADRTRAEEDQRFQRESEAREAGRYGMAEAEHGRKMSEPLGGGSTDSDTEQKLGKWLDVFSSKTVPEALPGSLFARLRGKLQGLDPDDPKTQQIVFAELTGKDKSGYQVAAGVPESLLDYPELQNAIEDYLKVQHGDVFFGDKKSKGFRWPWQKKTEEETDEYESLLGG